MEDRNYGLDMIGAFIRWTFGGFKGQYKKILKEDNPPNRNRLIGMGIILLIALAGLAGTIMEYFKEY